MRFKIDWASLIAGMKFTVFALFFFVFEGNFHVQAPGGAYIRRGDLTEGFLRYEFGGLIFGGAYFRNFMVITLIRDKPCAITPHLVTVRRAWTKRFCDLTSCGSRMRSISNNSEIAYNGPKSSPMPDN